MYAKDVILPVLKILPALQVAHNEKFSEGSASAPHVPALDHCFKKKIASPHS